MASMLPGTVSDLIEEITGYLGLQDLCALRLSCKDLSRKCLYTFGRRYLNTLTTDLSRQSLQSLASLANNAPLSCLVEGLVVKLGPRGLGQAFQWHRHEKGHLLYHENDCVAILQSLLVHGLVNCRNFTIHSVICDEGRLGREIITPTDALGLILAVVAESGLSIQSLHIDFRSQGMGRVDAERLQLARFWTPQFIQVWSELKCLELGVSLTSDVVDDLSDLITAAQNLQKLSLNLGGHASGIFLDCLTAQNTLHGLEDLDLYSLALTEAQFHQILSRSEDTLRNLSLWFLDFGGNGEWESVLRSLKNSHPRLRKISVLWLSKNKVSPSNESKTCVTHAIFPKILSLACSEVRTDLAIAPKRFDGRKMIFGADYEGKYVGKALDALADSISYL